MRFAFTLLSALMFSFCYAQNVGIGITTPAVPLHIKNNGSELLRLQGNDPHLSFFDNSGVAKGFLQSQGNNLNLGLYTGNTTGLIQFYTNNSLAMVVDPNSNVGIGTSFPGFKLTVETVGTGPGVVHRNNDVSVGTAVGLVSGINGGWYGTFSNHPLMFFTNASAPQITLLQNGNVGIGTTNPLGRLHINSGGNALTLSGNSPYIYYLDAGGIAKGFLWNNGGNNMDLGTEVGNNSGEVKLTIRGIDGLTVQSDARVRVGANSSISTIPLHGLPNFTVNGPLAIKMLFSPFVEWSIAAFTEALAFYKNGNSRAYIDDNGDWISVSDASLKENVKIFRPVLSQITKLQVSTYQLKWNSRSDLSFGLIAQNVKEYFPEIVSENIDRDGKRLLGISYAKTGVLAIKAIQEQQDIIEIHEKKIDEQQEIIKDQQKRIDELEKRLLKLENRLK